MATSSTPVPTLAPTVMPTLGYCDTACVAVSVVLSLLVFACGCFAIFYYRDKIALLRRHGWPRKSSNSSDRNKHEHNNSSPKHSSANPEDGSKENAQATASFGNEAAVEGSRHSSVYHEVDLESGPTSLVGADAPVAASEAPSSTTATGFYPESPETRTNKLRAESLEDRIKQMEEEQAELEAKSQRLQEEIKFLSKMNNVMALDNT